LLIGFVCQKVLVAISSFNKCSVFQLIELVNLKHGKKIELEVSENFGRERPTKSQLLVLGICEVDLFLFARATPCLSCV
jgi:hypothetical protein